MRLVEHWDEPNGGCERRTLGHVRSGRGAVNNMTLHLAGDAAFADLEPQRLEAGEPGDLRWQRGHITARKIAAA